MSNWGFQIENYLKKMMPMSMIFTMDGEGNFWALFRREDGYYEWSRHEAALFWTDQAYYPDPVYSMSGEMVPIVAMPKTVATDHDVNMAWHLAQQWGGFMVNPMEVNCPVEVNWVDWVLYADKDSRLNVKFNLVGMG